jgi:hypothetical protein
MRATLDKHRAMVPAVARHPEHPSVSSEPKNAPRCFPAKS